MENCPYNIRKQVGVCQRIFGNAVDQEYIAMHNQVLTRCTELTAEATLENVSFHLRQVALLLISVHHVVQQYGKQDVLKLDKTQLSDCVDKVKSLMFEVIHYLYSGPQTGLPIILAKTQEEEEKEEKREEEEEEDDEKKMPL